MAQSVMKFLGLGKGETGASNKDSLSLEEAKTELIAACKTGNVGTVEAIRDRTDIKEVMSHADDYG